MLSLCLFLKLYRHYLISGYITYEMSGSIFLTMKHPRNFKWWHQKKIGDCKSHKTKVSHVVVEHRSLKWDAFPKYVYNMVFLFDVRFGLPFNIYGMAAAHGFCQTFSFQACSMVLSYATQSSVYSNPYYPIISGRNHHNGCVWVVYQHARSLGVCPIFRQPNPLIVPMICPWSATV